MFEHKMQATGGRMCRRCAGAVLHTAATVKQRRLL